MPALAPPPGSLLAFDRFTLDLGRGVLTVETREVVLRPKTAAVLAQLLAHAGQVVSRDALLSTVWGDIAVTDDSLTQCVSEIRRALGAEGARVLQTHARRGYMMATRVRPVAHPASEPPEPPPPQAPPPQAPAPQALAPSPVSAPAPAAPRSRLAWVALAIGCGAAALSATAWMRPGPVAPPPTAAPSLSRAWVLVQAGRDAQQGDGSFEEGLRASLPLFLRALAIEPRLAEAAAQAAFVHLNLRINGFSRDPDQELHEAQRLVALAMETNPALPLALGAQATLLWQQRRFAEAIPFFERAGQSLERVADRANIGIMHLMLGNPEAAQPPLRAALREEPEHRFRGSWRSYLALAQLMAGQPDEAAELFLNSAGRFFPAEDRALYRLAALLAAGREAEARALRAELQERYPAPRTQPLMALGLSEVPRYRDLFEAKVLVPLRRMNWFEAGP